MPRLVYIHQYFKTPEEQGSTRSFHLAAALAAQGVEVVMVTAGSEAKEEFISGIRVIYVPVPYSNKMGVWARIKAFISFFRAAKLIVADLQPDLIYATSTPLSVGSLARRISKKLGVPYIFEVRDLWPDFPIQAGVLKGPFAAYFKREERKIYRDAKLIVALSEDMLKAVQQRTETPAVCVPNFSFFEPIPDLKPSLKIAYFGSLGRFNGIENWKSLLETAVRIHQPIELHVWGEGFHESTLKALPNLVYHGAAPKRGMAEAIQQSGCSFSLISFSKLPVLKTNAPNKLSDSLAMQLPIITTTDGWMRQLAESGCGVHWEFGKEAELIDQLLQADFNQMRVSCGEAFGRFNGRRVVQNWTNIIKPFLP